MMDVLLPALPDLASLRQTSARNADDADWFIDPHRGMGVAGDYFAPLKRFQNGEWQRMVIVIDTTPPSGGDNTVYRVYINGALHNIVQRPSGWGRDGRFALQDVILIFADENFETAPGWINNLQFRNYPMSDAEVADLGGPTAGDLPVAFGVTGSWNFDDTYDAQVGTAAQLVGAGNFMTDTIGGQSAQVLFFERNSYLRIEHGIAPNGGGSRVNQYSIIMDIKFPSNRTSFNGFTCLFQTNPANTDDGDCFINAANGIGISADYGDPTNVRFTANEWQRIALVVDTTSPLGNATYKSYVNGVLQNQVQIPQSLGAGRAVRAPECVPRVCGQQQRGRQRVHQQPAAARLCDERRGAGGVGRAHSGRHPHPCGGGRVTRTLGPLGAPAAGACHRTRG